MPSPIPLADSPMLIIGLMSGTSADGTDAALLQLEGEPPAISWRLLAHTSTPHPAALRRAILQAYQPEHSSSEWLCALNVHLAEQFAQAAADLCRQAGVSPQKVDLIGSHGQTVWHTPGQATLQLGEPAILAERTGITTISNFRPRDIAAGGQGAPLVGWVDRLLFTHPTLNRVCLNIGGIANITWLPAVSAGDDTVLAFDTGPGNCLLDLAAAQFSNGALTFDQGGRMAAAGQVDESLLAAWLAAEPYFNQHPPKTTGRELFSPAYLTRLLGQGQLTGLTTADFMATLTAFTARSIQEAIQHFLPGTPAQIILSGGGAENPVLFTMLQASLPGVEWVDPAQLGLPASAKEAAAFAVLAYETWHARPSNLASATGARHPVVLGSITPGDNYCELLAKTIFAAGGC